MTPQLPPLFEMGGPLREPLIIVCFSSFCTKIMISTRKGIKGIRETDTSKRFHGCRHSSLFVVGIADGLVHTTIVVCPLFVSNEKHLLRRYSNEFDYLLALTEYSLLYIQVYTSIYNTFKSSRVPLDI